MIKNILYKVIYLIVCLLSLILIYNNDLEKSTKIFLMIILSVIYSIVPIKFLVSFISEYTYSKFIKRFLETEEKHYLMLADFDDTYKAMLIKMEKVVEYKNEDLQSR